MIPEEKKMTPFLDFYNKSVKARRMPVPGLCYEFDSNIKDSFVPPDIQSTFNMFKPSGHEIKNLYSEQKSSWYFGSDSGSWLEYQFTPLRQTIVLFCAAINNEL